MVKKLSFALIGGAFGAICLDFVVSFYYGFSNDSEFVLTLYQLVMYTSAWSLLFIFPFMDKKQWFLKTLIIATIAILFNFTVLMPLNGAGFFASDASLSIFLGNIIFNSIWCIIAGYWYHLCVTEE